MSDERYWDDAVVGDECITPSVTVTEAMVNGYAELTGDFTPVHVDEEYARTTPFGTRVAHGLFGLSLADGAATLTAFTARTVEKAVHILPAPPNRWLVCGGGRRNPARMAAVRGELAAPGEPVEMTGWPGDAREAQAFGFLAVRSLKGLPLSLPSTTGVAKPTTGGVLHKPG